MAEQLSPDQISDYKRLLESEKRHQEFGEMKNAACLVVGSVGIPVGAVIGSAAGASIVGFFGGVPGAFVGGAKGALIGGAAGFPIGCATGIAVVDTYERIELGTGDISHRLGIDKTMETINETTKYIGEKYDQFIGSQNNLPLKQSNKIPSK